MATDVTLDDLAAQREVKQGRSFTVSRVGHSSFFAESLRNISFPVLSSMSSSMVLIKISFDLV